MDPLKLHDIKTIVDIADDSIYYFYTLLGFTAVLLLIGIYFALRYFLREKEVDLQKGYLEKLNDIDLTNTKESAYLLTYYGNLLEKDSHQITSYETLIEFLDEHKYRKNVHTFSRLTRDKIDDFVSLMND